MKEKESQKYSFAIKTPVHIGTGERLGRMDFILQGNLCVIVDFDKVLFEFKDKPEALNKFEEEGFAMRDLSLKYKIAPAMVQKYSLHNPGNIRPFNIQEMIKTGMGNPLMPGTSIKGAIRTVLLWHLFEEKNKKETANILKRILDSEVKKEQADDELDHFLFGPDSNHDLLRGLQVGDVEFKLSHLQLLESRVLSLEGNNGFGWKKMGKGGFNTPDPKKATPTCCESLSPGAVSVGRLKLEGFLFDNSLAKRELGFSDKKELLVNLPEKCNQYAKVFIANEIDFFESCNMEEMVNFYNALQKEIPEDKGFFLLHLGWGSGWRGMTGNYLSEADLIDFRKRFSMGEKSFPVFPKTRKIAFENSKPKYPLGWIKVEKIKEGVSKKDQPIEIITTKPKAPPQSELMKNFEEFRLSPSPGNFRKFIEKIKPDEIDELKRLSFEKLRESINIGFVTPLIECEASDEIKKVLAGKFLEFIKKSKKWKGAKLEKYNNLKAMAG
jgi:CRISPR-associated protein Csm5